MPVDRQSKRLTEKTLQKRMTKIDIAFRNKVYKTAVFHNSFLTKLLRNQTTRTESEKH